MSYFCYLDSSNNVENTNLQLYSLRKASEEWNDFIKNDEVEYYLEKIVFIISCLGLSLSQLLGQNSLEPNKEKIDAPKILFKKVSQNFNIERSDKTLLRKKFNSFIDFYDTIRHFGMNKDCEKHKLVENLKIQDLRNFIKLTIKIWDLVIKNYSNDGNNIEISSINEIIHFDNIT